MPNALPERTAATVAILQYGIRNTCIRQRTGGGGFVFGPYIELVWSSVRGAGNGTHRPVWPPRPLIDRSRLRAASEKEEEEGGAKTVRRVWSGLMGV